MLWRKWVRWTMVWKKFKWNVINEVDIVTREELRSSDYVVMCCEHPPWPRGRNVANCAVDLYSFNKSITDEIRFFPIDSMQISDNIMLKKWCRILASDMLLNALHFNAVVNTDNFIWSINFLYLFINSSICISNSPQRENGFPKYL